MNKRPDWDTYFLNIAKAICMRSTCLRRNYEAVIVDSSKAIVSTGYNGSPVGDINCCDYGKCKREELHVPKGERYELCKAIHAEQNALLQCPNVMAIRKIYSTTSPCIHCAKLILNTGTREVFYLNKAYDIGAILLLHSAKIECTRIFMPDERFADAGI